MALADVPTDNVQIHSLSGTLLDSGSGAPVRMFRKTNAIPMEPFRVTWSKLTAAEVQTLRAVYDTAGPAGPVAWTVQGEGSPRVFCIADYSETAFSAADFQVEMELHYMPGVTI